MPANESDLGRYGDGSALLQLRSAVHVWRLARVGDVLVRAVSSPAYGAQCRREVPLC